MTIETRPEVAESTESKLFRFTLPTLATIGVLSAVLAIDSNKSETTKTRSDTDFSDLGMREAFLDRSYLHNDPSLSGAPLQEFTPSRMDLPTESATFTRSQEIRNTVTEALYVFTDEVFRGDVSAETLGLLSFALVDQIDYSTATVPWKGSIRYQLLGLEEFATLTVSPGTGNSGGEYVFDISIPIEPGRYSGQTSDGCEESTFTLTCGAQADGSLTGLILECYADSAASATELASAITPDNPMPHGGVITISPTGATYKNSNFTVISNPNGDPEIKIEYGIPKQIGGSLDLPVFQSLESKLRETVPFS